MGEREPILSDDERRQFDLIIGGLDDRYEYDRQLGGYLIKLDEDIQRIIDDFNNHVAEAEALDPDVPMSPTDYAAVAQLMDATLSRLNSLKLGDQVVASGKVLILDETEPGHSDVILADEGCRIQGEFMNLVMCEVPELAFYDEDKNNVERNSIGIGLMLAECKLAEPDSGARDAPFLAKQVMVVLSPHDGAVFHKLI